MSDNKCHKMPKNVMVFSTHKAGIPITYLLSTKKNLAWLGTDIAI